MKVALMLAAAAALSCLACDVQNDRASPSPSPTATPASTATPSSSATPAPIAGNTNPPASAVRIIFIHHSCGQNWLEPGNGKLAQALNANNYYVSDTNYGWDAEANDNLGDATDTGNWPLWFNDTKAPFLYAETEPHSGYANSPGLAAPAGGNQIIMFKSCYPLSNVGAGIEDEKAIYNGLLAYFGAHTEKLFVLITPPGTATVPTPALTRQLCDWLVDRQNGWLKNYAHNNVAVYDFYCSLSETGSHHRVVNGYVEHVYASDYDGISPYHTGDDHPNATGNQKATAEYLPLLNSFYNAWRANP